MIVTIDPAGRLVIPQEIRDRLQLGAEAQFELRVEGRSLVVSPMRPRGRRLVMRDGWPTLEPVEGLRMSDAEVQQWRDDGQR